MATCANGHDVPSGNQFCSICGLQVSGVTTPPPAPPPVLPSYAPSHPEAPRRKKGWFIGAGALAILVIGVLLVVILNSGGGAAPLTSATADEALLTSASLPLDMIANTDSTNINPNSPFEPDTTAPCTTVKGVSRLTDLDLSMPLGSTAFPDEARDITVFTGNDFKDPTDSVVATFEERLIVFPSDADATTYIGRISEALADCPQSEIVFSNDGTVFRVTEDYRDIEQSDGRLSWYTDNSGSMDSDIDALDISFRALSGSHVVQRGPNVLIVEWYRDDETSISRDDFEAASTAAIDRFVQTTG